MSTDPEIEQLKAGVNCATVLERMGGGYALDQKESSRMHQKYRRGAGEIIIINHEGKGWWNPGSDAKGDVFTLAQHLDPSLNFGQVRGVLRHMMGMAPSYAAAPDRQPKEKKPAVPPAERWRARPALKKGSRTWAYLTVERALPEAVLVAAARADAVREGPYSSAWFAHRDTKGGLTGVEMRGPDFRGFSEDGNKSLFRFQPGQDAPTRLAVVEAPIDAMSMAALEGMRRDTLYIATGGGMGPGTVADLEREMGAVASRGGTLTVATDSDVQGQKYAARLKAMAEDAGLSATRALPADNHKDWNELLKARTATVAPSTHPRFSTALAAVARAMEPALAAGRQPWEPVPARMAARVQAFEERSALAAAQLQAARSGQDQQPGPDPTRRPSPGPSPQP